MTRNQAYYDYFQTLFDAEIELEYNNSENNCTWVLVDKDNWQPKDVATSDGNPRNTLPARYRLANQPKDCPDQLDNRNDYINYWQKRKNAGEKVMLIAFKTCNKKKVGVENLSYYDSPMQFFIEKIPKTSNGISKGMPIKYIGPTDDNNNNNRPSECIVYDINIEHDEIFYKNKFSCNTNYWEIIDIKFTKEAIKPKSKLKEQIMSYDSRYIIGSQWGDHTTEIATIIDINKNKIIYTIKKGTIHNWKISGFIKNYYIPINKNKPIQSKFKIGDVVCLNKLAIKNFTKYVDANATAIITNIELRTKDSKPYITLQSTLLNAYEIDEHWLDFAYLKNSCIKTKLPNKINLLQQKENKMETCNKHITITMTAAEYAKHNKQCKPTKLKTDLETRKPWTVVYYAANGKRDMINYYTSQKKARKACKKFLQTPTGLGYTVTIHKEIETFTTNIPIITTKS